LFCNNYQLISFMLGFGINMTNNLLIILPLHNHVISQDVNVHVSMVLMLKIFLDSEGLPCLTLFATKPYTFFKCLVNNHLTHYAIMQIPTLHFHFNPTFIHFLSFWTILGGQGGVDGWEAWSVSSCGFKPRNIYIYINIYFVIKKS